MPPGKLGPRLVQDLLHYDPRHESHTRRNLLQDPPPHWEGDPEPSIPEHHCTHDLALKPEQSSLGSTSANGNGASASTRKVACFCTKCRVHIDIIVSSSTEDGASARPCHIRDPARPLHHFISTPELAIDEDGKPLSDTCVWRCSSSRCPAKLTISFRLPTFTEHDIELMTDKVQLQTRWKRSHELSAGRADADPARPVDAPDFLVRYLSDSLQPTSGKNRIPVLNRKFLKTFGEDCDHILERLGFKLVTEQSEDGDDEPVRAWYIPNSSADGEKHDKDQADIEDAIYELKAVLKDYPMAQRTNLKSPQPNLKAALPSIENVLGFPQVEYSPLLVPSSRNFRREEPEHPYYAALGAVSEFGDDLLYFAYEAQSKADPTNKAYYFECLKDIAMGRNSEKLTFSYQLLASKGLKTSGDIAAACRELGLNLREMRELTDDEILGQFIARYDNSGPDAKLKLRQALDIIGTERDSGKLIREASETIDTYEDALRFFDLAESMNDEWVTVMYRQKCQDDPAIEATAIKAVQIIANHRKSDVLHSFIATGELGTREMDISEAYTILRVQDRSQAPDLDVLETQRDAMIADNPNDAEKLHKAFELVREDVTRHQTTSLLIQNGIAAFPPAHSLETWPVGCRNLGNTCYLNSVLQFLFTIKPLRERVLNCGEYFQELSLEALENKRVGSKVTLDMVEHGQKFVYQLRSLFEQMIFANTDSVRPEMELACLALDKVSVAEAAAATEAPQETADQEEFADQNPVTILITPESPEPEAKSKSEDAPAQENEKAPTEDNTQTAFVPKGMQEPTPPVSEDNIMMGPVDFDRSAIDQMRGIGTGLDTQMDDASSTKAEHDDDDDGSSTKTELNNDTSSTTMELDQDGDQQMEYVGTDASASAPARELPAFPSGNPPPIPPRPTHVLGRIEEAARQQDANDILLRIFDLFSYAFKGDGVMGDDGEQFDIIKELFFLIVKEVNMSDGKAVEKRESCHHVVPGGHDRPLYAALEDSFQPEEDEQGKRYSYIEKAPPIMLVAIGRVEWKNNESVRDNSHLSLDEVLYLDRYMGQTASMSHDKLQAKRQQYWDLLRQKRVLQELLNLNVVPNSEQVNEDMKLSLPDALGMTSNYLSRLNATSPEKLIDVDSDSDALPHFPDLPSALDARRLELTQEYDACTAEIEALDTAVGSHWTDLTEVPYRLHAIFMHRGSAAVGHYWIYIYDFQNQVWREYNDETVREVSPETVYAQHERASSTVVVYVRDKDKCRYTEAVCRKPGETGGVTTRDSSTGDVEMTPPPEPEFLPSTSSKNASADVAMEDEGFVDGNGKSVRPDRGQPEPMSDVQVIEGVEVDIDAPNKRPALDMGH